MDAKLVLATVVVDKLCPQNYATNAKIIIFPDTAYPFVQTEPSKFPTKKVANFVPKIVQLATGH